MRPVLAAGILMLASCATVEEPALVPDREPPPQAMVDPPAPAAKVVPPPRPALVAPVPTTAAKPSEADILLADFERLRRLPAAEVVREQEAARQAFNQSRSDAARVRFAMTLAIPGISGNDDVRALEFLEPLVKNPIAGMHGLAFLLSAYIQEHRRLTTQLQGLQQNVQALQQKLDALRSLERSLTERQPSRRR